MTAYTAVSVSRSAGANLATALTAVTTSSDTFPPGSDIFLRVKNTGTTDVTVTVIATGANAGPSGTFLAPLALAPVTAGTTGDRLYGPFPAAAFADPSDGQVHVSYSATTNVTAGVFRVAP